MNCVKQLFHRYLVQAMSAMALGLFSSLIIGLIISQFAKIPSLEFLAGFTQVLSADSPVVGGAIGAAIAYGLKHKPLVIFSCVAVGAFGYSVGGSVGAYLGAVLGAEVGGLVAGKTKVDIILTPIVTILSGCLFAQLTGPAVQALMTGLGNILKSATELEPLPMGILISVIVGLALTAPISSAALCIMMELDGLAGGDSLLQSQFSPLYRFQSEQAGHHLGDGGGVHLFVGVELIQDLIGVRVHQNSGLGIHGHAIQNGAAAASLRGGGKGCGQRERQNQGHKEREQS